MGHTKNLNGSATNGSATNGSATNGSATNGSATNGSDAREDAMRDLARNQRGRRVLFIGATGRVGHQVVPLLAPNFAITATALGGGRVGGLEALDLDITDWDAVARVVEAGASDGQPYDAIVNCAIADTRTLDRNDPDSFHNYNERCIEVNACGSYHICEAAARFGVSSVVYVSSMTAVFGAPRYSAINEDSVDRPRDVYAACKIFGEHVGRTYAFPREDRPSLQVVCLRLGMPFPVFTGSDRAWQNNINRRGAIVHMEDVARSIECALVLSPEVRFGVYTIVSASDKTYVAPNLYAELGYTPGWKFTDQGVTRLPIGDEAPVFTDGLSNGYAAGYLNANGVSYDPVKSHKEVLLRGHSVPAAGAKVAAPV